MQSPPPTVHIDDSANATLEIAPTGKQVLDHLLDDAPHSPSSRRLSQMDNSLRRLPAAQESESDDSSDGPSLAALQKAVGLDGVYSEDDSDDDSDVDLATMVLSPSAGNADKKTPEKNDGSTPNIAASKKKAERSAGLKKQLLFLGKQFNAKNLDALDVKHVVDAEKKKREVYTFEWESNEQKPEWKQALLLSTAKPGDGLKYLGKCGLLKTTALARARWLSHYRKMVLDNPIVIEWLCQDANLPILECMVEHENSMGGLDLDVAFRKFVYVMDYLPKDDALKRLLLVFGNEYSSRNPHRKEIQSGEAAAYVCNIMLALNNVYHTGAKKKKIRISDWLIQSNGKNENQDFPQGMLEEFFGNVVTLPISFEDPSLFQGERRHGWINHKILEAKGWKKHWALLTDKGELILLPEDGSKDKQGGFQTIDLHLAKLRNTKSSEKNFLLAVQTGERIHLIQINSEWARSTWLRHISKFAEVPEGKGGMVVALKDKEFSPSPIRSALKGHKRKTSVASNAKATLKLGGGFCPPDEGLDGDEIPEGALEAFNEMNLE